MDHSVVNAQFVSDLITALTDRSLYRTVERLRHGSVAQILDLGSGTAQIPIELARRASNAQITAIDAAESMLRFVRQHVTAANLGERIDLLMADAKRLPFESGSFSAVISNSIVHHIAEPRVVLEETVRVCVRGGLLFHRDLMRPENDARLEHTVKTYAGTATAYQRLLFSNSLRAALTVDEMRGLIADLGFSRDTVIPTSDRHWTWAAMRS